MPVIATDPRVKATGSRRGIGKRSYPRHISSSGIVRSASSAQAKWKRLPQSQAKYHTFGDETEEWVGDRASKPELLSR